MLAAAEHFRHGQAEMIRGAHRACRAERDGRQAHRRHAPVDVGVLASEQSQQPQAASAPLGEFFKDAIVTERTGVLRAPDIRAPGGVASAASTARPCSTALAHATRRIDGQ